MIHDQQLIHIPTFTPVYKQEEYQRSLEADQEQERQKHLVESKKAQEEKEEQENKEAEEKLAAAAQHNTQSLIEQALRKVCTHVYVCIMCKHACISLCMIHACTWLQECSVHTYDAHTCVQAPALSPPNPYQKIQERCISYSLYTYNIYIHAHAPAEVSIYIYIYICIRTHICTYIHIHTYIYRLKGQFLPNQIRRCERVCVILLCRCLTEKECEGGS
jgi:hypothetical protein